MTMTIDGGAAEIRELLSCAAQAAYAAMPTVHPAS